MKPVPVIIESFRDAIQGISRFIPTGSKVKHLELLLQCGFDIVDAGSFVSPKFIPQMADFGEVLEMLAIPENASKIMVLVVNEKGTAEACNNRKVDILSYPHSLSASFLKLNLNRTVNESKKVVSQIQNHCYKSEKQFILYLTMGFGNPYNDLWTTDHLLETVDEFAREGITRIRLSDITGEASKETIGMVYRELYSEFRNIEFGFHLHSKPSEQKEKLIFALNNGCISFDSVLGGIGGCPMTGYELVGNLDTKILIEVLESQKISHNLTKELIKKALLNTETIINP